VVPRTARESCLIVAVGAICERGRPWKAPTNVGLRRSPHDTGIYPDVGMSRTPVEVSDERVAELREHFDDAQLVELRHHIALENARGRFNLALGVGAAGFSEGMVGAVPATVVSHE
jgi:hypothetical protein